MLKSSVVVVRRTLNLGAVYTMPEELENEGFTRLKTHQMFATAEEFENELNVLRQHSPSGIQKRNNHCLFWICV